MFYFIIIYEEYTNKNINKQILLFKIDNIILVKDLIDWVTNNVNK